MKKSLYTVLYIISAVLFFSCVGRKKITYFQGKMSDSSSSVKNYDPILRCDDLLSIVVSGIDLETAKPFNQPVQNTSNPTAGGYVLGNQQPTGYLIGIDGTIDFPVVGKIKVEGIKRSQLSDTLKARLSPYLANPAIQVRILNFKVTVLGEVTKPGTFTIPNERITLPEALGIAGDLTIAGKRKNILVIRDIDGKKTEYRVDLTSKDIFSSPVYYLNQNDLVYVEPNHLKVNSSFIGQTATVASILSTIALMIATILVIAK